MHRTGLSAKPAAVDYMISLCEVYRITRMIEAGDDWWEAQDGGRGGGRKERGRDTTFNSDVWAEERRSTTQHGTCCPQMLPPWSHLKATLSARIFISSEQINPLRDKKAGINANQRRDGSWVEVETIKSAGLTTYKPVWNLFNPNEGKRLDVQKLTFINEPIIDYIYLNGLN